MVTERERVPMRERVRPELAWALVAGIVVGGLLGTTGKASGSIYTTLFFAVCLLLVALGALVGGPVAAATRRPDPARALAAFAGLSVIAGGSAYALFPGYRSPDADVELQGTVAVHVAQPAELEWHGAATCRTHAGSSSVFLVFMPDVRVGDRSVAVLVRMREGTTPVEAQLSVAFSSSAGGADYTASPAQGLLATKVGADGRSGLLRFAADRVPIPGRSPSPDRDWLGGTVEWTCE